MTRRTRPKWVLLSAKEKQEEILREISDRQVPSRVLADRCVAPWAEVDEILAKLKSDGLVLVNGRRWYRLDIPPQVKPPKPPYVSKEREKFLKKQGNLPF